MITVRSWPPATCGPPFSVREREKKKKKKKIEQEGGGKAMTGTEKGGWEDWWKTRARWWGGESGRGSHGVS